jgi:hypothetical protein
MLCFNDVRVGNILADNGSLFRLDPLILMRFFHEGIRPVPINYRRLTHLGFCRTARFNEYPGLRGAFEMKIDKKYLVVTGKWAFGINDVHSNCVWPVAEGEQVMYVHQLQNLAHDVTGVELQTENLINNERSINRFWLNPFK